MNLTLLLGSLAGVLGLAAIAWMMGLGGGGIAGPEEAMRLAEESLGGFTATDAFVSEDGLAALVSGEGADAALLKAHGTQVAARRLSRPLRIAPEESGVAIDSGERMFGPVRLRLAPADRDRLLTMR